MYLMIFRRKKKIKKFRPSPVTLPPGAILFGVPRQLRHSSASPEVRGYFFVTSLSPVDSRLFVGQFSLLLAGLFP